MQWVRSIRSLSNQVAYSSEVKSPSPFFQVQTSPKTQDIQQIYADIVYTLMVLLYRLIPAVYDFVL